MKRCVLATMTFSYCFPAGNLSRNYPYVNDSHKVAQRYHLSHSNLPMESGQLKNEFSVSIGLKGCGIAWERSQAPTKIAAFN